MAGDSHLVTFMTSGHVFTSSANSDSITMWPDIHVEYIVLLFVVTITESMNDEWCSLSGLKEVY